MSSIAAGQIVAVAFPVMDVTVPDGAVPLLVAMASGVVGMSIKNVFDSILSDGDGADESDGEDLDDLGGDGGLMADEGADEDLGDLGGLGGGDDLGGFDDEGEEFGDMEMGGGGGGAATDELENRLDDLENEVGSLQSTVNTVRNENEQIGEQVDEIEENIRKLLDIYEMVTRGVNPFADDIQAGTAGGMDGDGFGLFDDDDDGEDGDDEIDEEIANADAEGFFDDDLVEDGDDDDDLGGIDSGIDDVMDSGSDDGGFEDDGGTFDDDFDGGDGLDDLDGMDDGGDEFADVDDFGGGSDGDDSGDGSDDGEGGKSFQELKEEYESGDAEWADGEDGEDETGPADETIENGDATESSDGEADPTTDGTVDEMDAELDEMGDEDLLGDDGDGDDLDGDVVESGDVDDVLPSAGTEGDDDQDDAGLTGETTDETEPLTEAEALDEAVVSSTPDITDVSEADGDGAETVTDDGDTGGATGSAQPTGAEAGEALPDATGPAAGGAEAGTGEGEPETATASGPGKPYLDTLPDGYAADLIVIEWLEYLTEESSVRATSQAIGYYERIDWLDESVAEELRSFLTMFEGADDSGGTLTIDHHTQSLRYISQLGGDTADTVAMQLAGGGGRGLQR